MTTNPPPKPDGRATNAIKTGKRMRQAPRNGMTIGALGKGNGHIVVSLRQLRAALESAVTEQYGEVSLLHSAYINTACRHERTAQLSQRWLKENPDLPLADRLNLVRGIGAASDARDRALEKLKLGTKPADLWADLHQPNAAHVAHEARTRDLAADTASESTEPAATHEASE